MTLTEEQKALVERKRQEALARLKISQQAKANQTSSDARLPQPPRNPFAHPPVSKQPSNPGRLVEIFSSQPSGERVFPKGPAIVSATTWHSTANNSVPKSNGTSEYRPVAMPFFPQTTDFPKNLPPSKPEMASSHKIPVKGVLIANKRVEIQAGFCAPLVEFCKTFTTRQFDPVSRRWSIAYSEYESFNNKIRAELWKIVEWEGLPRFVVDILSKRSKNELDPSVVEKIKESLGGDDVGSLWKNLLPYQLEGVKFAVRNSGKILLADDMGLGKTIQAIAVSAYYKDDWPVLCVTPSSVRFEWKEQWLRWISSLKEDDIEVLTSSSQLTSKTAKIIITTYELLIRNTRATKKASVTDVSTYLGRYFPIVIFDESHLLKNYKSQRSGAASDFARFSRRLLLLSGTPALSRPSELYAQIQMVNPQIFRSFPEYGKRYCAARQQRWGWDYTGSSNVEELQVVLESTVMLRRLKQDVAQQLPKKHRTVVVLDKNKVQLKSPDLAEAAEGFGEAKRASGSSYMAIRQSLLVYYQLSGSAKVPAVLDYLKGALDKDATLKIVIFAHHLAVLSGIESGLQSYCGIRIDGSTAAETRKQLCDNFQKNSHCRVAVLSIMACCSGITLTAASMVVFAELHWTPGILMQAEDRLHRLGQKKDVNVMYLVAEGTADDHIWPLLKRKLDFLNDVGLSTDNFKDVDREKQPGAVAPKFSVDLEKILTEDAEPSGPSGSPTKRPRVEVEEVQSALAPTTTDDFDQEWNDDS